MASFSITEAATAGLTVVRRNPRALVAWAGIGLVTAILAMVVFYVLGGDNLQKAAEVMTSGRAVEPEEANALVRPLLPAYAAACIVALVAHSILTPAVYRTVLQPQMRAPGNLRFGPDELRQFVVTLAILATVFGVDAGLNFGLQAIAAATGVSALVVIGSPAIFVLVIFLLVRLSLAGPDTLVKSRVSFSAGWKMSKGAFGPMFAANVLAVLFQVMIFVGLLILMVLMAGVSAGASRLGPAGGVVICLVAVFYLVAVSLLYALGVAVTTAPAAHIYRALTARPADA